jgi:hypothetical protein
MSKIEWVIPAREKNLEKENIELKKELAAQTHMLNLTVHLADIMA